MSTFELAQLDPSKKKIEQPTQTAEASPKKQAESSRTQKIIRAFSETFQRVFQPEKFRANKQEGQLRDELVSRGFLRQEAALGMNNDELQYALRDAYARKINTLDELKSPNRFEDDEMTIFFNLTKENIPSIAVAPEGSNFFYQGSDIETKNVWENQKQLIDGLISDNKLLEWENIQAKRAEKEREENFHQKLKNLWEGNQNKINQEWKDLEAAEKQSLRDREMKRKTDFWETLKGDEEADLNRVESLCQKGNLSQEDVGSLQKWLHYHKEFGLGEMSDEEYNSFFQDGRFYVHGSSFFGTLAGDRKSNQSELYTSKFIGALKDGYLIGRNIADKRNKQVTGSGFPESLVYFCDQDTKQESIQIAGNDTTTNVPVLLISPAKLLENHSFRSPVDKNGQQIGAGFDGIPFGSGNIDNSFDRKHEIDLSLFVMLLPDIKIQPEMLDQLKKDLSDVFKNNQEQDQLEKSIESAKIGSAEVSLQDFMSNLFAALSKEGIRTPRLFFYEFGKKLNSFGKPETSGVENLRGGIGTFIEKNKIQLPDKSFDFSDIDPLGPEGYQKIPENYRVDRERMEEVANEVRKIIKRQQIETAAKEGTVARQEAQNSEDLAAMEKTRSRLQSL